MSTLTEIEEAVEALSQREQRRLLESLEKRLARPSKNIPSLHDRMKSGCGIVDSGIPDLATNKRHMEGFGQWRR